MDPVSLLHEAGQAMFGSTWQSDMARELPMSLRHVQRLAAGKSPVTESMWADIRALMKRRGMKLAEVRRKLPR
jgi:hypothetical protein